MTGGKIIVSVDVSVVLRLEGSFIGSGSCPGSSYSILSTGVAATDTFKGVFGNELDEVSDDGG